MLRIRILRCAAIACGLAVSVDTRSHGELIVEIHNIGNCFDCSPAGSFFSFSALISPFDITQTKSEWTMFVTPGDVGRTLMMPSDLVSGFNAILTDPRLVYGTMNCCGAGGGGNGFPTPRLNQTNTSGDPITINRVAPNRGLNLGSYRVTEITQTIDQLTYEQISSNLFRGNGSHTVRIYGEQIPEPAGWVSIVIGLIASHRLRIRLTSRKLRPFAGCHWLASVLRAKPLRPRA